MIDDIDQRIDDAKHELEIAEHNLWVAKTNVEDRQEEVTRDLSVLEKLVEEKARERIYSYDNPDDRFSFNVHANFGCQSCEFKGNYYELQSHVLEECHLKYKQLEDVKIGV